MKDLRFSVPINAIYDPNNLRVRFVRECNEKKSKIIEESWQLVIKPKPKFVPFFIWQWLLNRLMYVKVGTDIRPADPASVDVTFGDGRKSKIVMKEAK